MERELAYLGKAVMNPTRPFVAPQDRDKGTCGIHDSFAEIGQLSFHEQPGGGLLDKAGDADHGGVRAMRRAESVANEHAVTERGKLFGKTFIVFLDRKSTRL